MTYICPIIELLSEQAGFPYKERVMFVNNIKSCEDTAKIFNPVAALQAAKSSNVASVITCQSKLGKKKEYQPDNLSCSGC